MNKYFINEDLAKSAKEMNSFSDYRPNSATTEYNTLLEQFEASVNELLERYPENINEDASNLIEYYKDKYAKKLAFAFNKRNSIEARMPSVMIAGPSNFNWRKKEKQNSARENFWKEYASFFSVEDNYYFKKIKTLITNKTIYSDDALAIEKLNAKIDKLTDLQSKMKAVNTFYRKNKNLNECDLLTEKEKIELKQTLQMFPYYNQPYPSFELTNNNAKIKRLQERLEDLIKLKERTNNENKYPEIEGLKVVEDTNDMRIRILFDEIPNEETRTTLKQNGFKWSPKNSAWQRQLTNNGIYSTKKLLNELKEKNNGTIL